MTTAMLTLDKAVLLFKGFVLLFSLKFKKPVKKQAFYSLISVGYTRFDDSHLTAGFARFNDSHLTVGYTRSLWFPLYGKDNRCKHNLFASTILYPKYLVLSTLFHNFESSSALPIWRSKLDWVILKWHWKVPPQNIRLCLTESLKNWIKPDLLFVLRISGSG